MVGLLEELNIVMIMVDIIFITQKVDTEVYIMELKQDVIKKGGIRPPFLIFYKY